MMRLAHTRTKVPSAVSGYPLGNIRLSVYQPQAAVNLVDNPSIERATTNYTAVGGSIARSATRQRFGTYSLAVTPTAGVSDGVYYGGTTPVVLTAGTIYYGSVFGYFAPGVLYKIYFASTAGSLVGTAVNFIGTGRWQRVVVPYQETSTTSRRLYVTKNNHASTVVFYLDGFNISDTLSTYVDGDQPGYVRGQAAYYWTGTPHASASVRVISTRAGGKEIKFSDYGFVPLGLVGLGLGGFENLSAPNAYVGGARFERTIYTDRTFDVVGVFQSPDGFRRLQEQRRVLENILRPNAAIISQPLTLIYQTVNDWGEAAGEPVEIMCSLEPGGMSGNWNNDFQEPVALTFKNYLPYLGAMQGEAGAAMGYQSTLASGNLFWRDTADNWTRMGNAALSDDVLAVLALPNGTYLVGGKFLNAGGDANADFLALYNPSTDTFAALNATPLNAKVNALALLPDGVTVLVGGDFTNAGTANGDFLCYLNINTGAFSAINATPLSARVNAIVMLNNGDALIGGEFQNAGTASGDGLIKLVGTVYTALNATPLVGFVLDSAKLPDGNVVFVGAFTSPVAKAGHLNVTTGVYTALNTTPFNNTAWAVAVDKSGKVYIGEDSIYSWDGPGAPFVELGTGTGAIVTDIVIGPDGNPILSGSFTAAGGLTLPGPMAGWNGSFFNSGEIVLATADAPYMFVMPDGRLVVATNNAVTGPFAVVTILTNDGTADTYPVFEFLGPGAVYSLKNYFTGDVLFFDLTLQAGERATLTLGPGNISFVSSYRGDIYSTILPGSFQATFRLTPGANNVSAFIAGTVDANTALTARWKVPYLSVDDALYR